MNRIPSMVRNSSSFRSLVSNITFDDESLISESDISESSGMQPVANKWSSGTELDTNTRRRRRTNSIADTVASSQPVPMPERKCSSNKLFDLPVKEIRSQALQQAMLGCQQTPKKESENLIDRYLKTKGKSSRRHQQSHTASASSRSRMANAKWDLTPVSSQSGSSSGGNGNAKWNTSDHNSTRPSLTSLLSSIGSSTDSSGDGRRASRPVAHMSNASFTRLSMDGTLECSTPLRKPMRKRSTDGFTGSDYSIPAMSPTSSSSSWSSLKKMNSFARSTHSTMPLTMPVRKSSQQNLLSLPSGSSSNALRKKLSRSKLSNSNFAAAPRRIGSASSMLRIQSRDRLRRHA